MRDGDDGTGEIMQKPLQPGHRFGIQMVCRFVQQQHVRRAEQQLAQGNAALFTTR